MPIAKIQLRGISRVPSDRLVADGACAESMNVVMHESETAPMAPPLDVTEESKPYTLAPGLVASGIDVLYIHKTNTYTNYIGVKLSGEDLVLYAYAKNNLGTWRLVSIATLPGAAAPDGISSIGNLLVYTVSSGMRYAIFKDWEYTDLGGGIPRPKVTFETSPQTESRQAWNPVCNNDGGSTPEKYPGLSTQIASMTTKEFWEYILEEVDRPEATGIANDDARKLYNDMAANIWDFVSEKRMTLRDDDVFVSPVLVRYAVRLYDGSYIYQSEPILLAGGTSHTSVQNILASIMDVNGILMFYYRLVMDQCYKATVNIELADTGKWKDFIEAVDIFMSTDILIPEENSLLDKGVDWSENPVVAGATFTQGSIMINFKGLETMVQDGGIIQTIPSVSRNAFEEQMLKKANFYRVASFSLDNLPEDEYITPIGADDLVVLPRLEDGDAHQVVGKGNLGTYNLRLVTGAQQVFLSPGHPEPHALVGGASGPEDRYAIVYYVRDEAGIEHVVRGFEDFDVIPEEMRAYVAYPDPRCSKAILYKYNTSAYTKMLTLPMKEHPRLNTSYGFWGLDKTLWPSSTPTDGRTLDDNVSGQLPANEGSYPVENRLALSEVQDPFFFPPEQRKMFSARILNAVPITVALSTGQFGYGDLYVFTEDGIWVMTLNSEGGLANPHPVSRDVAIEGTIAQLDQAIIFTSEQGVMLLSGSQVKNLSMEMRGRNFVPSAALIAAIHSYSQNLVISDNTPFLTFVKGAKPAYDYAGKRIVFFNPDHPTFQYVLALANQTWHRIKLPDAAPRSFNVLNSYPDCLVFFGNASASYGGKILDFSTLLNPNSTTNALPGLVVTRDLNFGGNDVYKTIKRLYIRGDRYPEAAPWKYVLLGSNDRKNYKILHSLRGPSWKFYRVAIATTMQQGGRISYIEIDWEPRFTDRIR